MQERYRIARAPAPLDPNLIALLDGIETATIGHFEQVGFVGAGIRPVFPARTAGRAVTVAAPGHDGRIIYTAIDTLEPGDVLIVARVDHDDLACVGGGVTEAVRAKGAVGVIVDGPCTDPGEIIENDLPVWCRGVSAKTTSRHVSIGGAINLPIACGGTAVLPGYCVLADESGVFVAPPDVMADIAKTALARQRRSLDIRRHLAAGKSIFDFDREHGQ